MIPRSRLVAFAVSGVLAALVFGIAKTLADDAALTVVHVAQRGLPAGLLLTATLFFAYRQRAGRR